MNKHLMIPSVLSCGFIRRCASVLCGLALLGFSSATYATDNRAPEVPANLTVPEGNRVHFHANAIGVQIYVCRNVSTTEVPQFAWVFVAPEAVLFDNDGNVVGLHYAGPTWESESGSKVVGSVLARSTVVGAIPWLLLQSVSSAGPGIFNGTTFVQRVNTVGGLAPSSGADAEHEGQSVRVPYTAEYFFYRAR